MVRRGDHTARHTPPPVRPAPAAVRNGGHDPEAGMKRLLCAALGHRVAVRRAGAWRREQFRCACGHRWEKRGLGSVLPAEQPDGRRFVWMHPGRLS